MQLPNPEWVGWDRSVSTMNHFHQNENQVNAKDFPLIIIIMIIKIYSTIAAGNTVRLH